MNVELIIVGIVVLLAALITLRRVGQIIRRVSDPAVEDGECGVGCDSCALRDKLTGECSEDRDQPHH